jgi:DNA processing protein
VFIPSKWSQEAVQAGNRRVSRGDRVNTELEQSTYVLALSQVEGLGARSLLRILKIFPYPDSLVEAPSELIRDKLGEELSRIVLLQLLARWEQAFSSAQQLISRHLEERVTPVSIMDSAYPPLLKLIPDPPLLLFVRGNLEALSSVDTVAVVGTRNATERGKEVASRVAKYFGKRGYVVVSGLAKGIDTAAHEGVLEVGAKTVAVLGTALNQIYPAENRGLAERIVNESGALITELPLGQKSFKNAFVQRDRIESGMSLAVIPVQSDISGGAMYTVKFAEMQGRLLFCQKPLASEQGLRQYAGIFELMGTQRAREFQAGDYESLLALLQEHKRKLLSAERTVVEVPVGESRVEAAPKRGRRKRKRESPKPQVTIGFVETEPDTRPLLTEEEVDKMVGALRQLGLDSNASRFEDAVSRIREKLYGQRKPERVPSRAGRASRDVKHRVSL